MKRPEAVLRDALAQALDRRPESADAADAALIVAKVVRQHCRQHNAAEVVRLAYVALVALDVYDVRTALEALK